MKRFIVLLLAAVLCTGYVHADTTASDYAITINSAARILRLYKSGVLVKEYPVAVGKTATKTPIGSFRIINMVVNPYWHNKGNVVAPGPRNPLGIRWMGLSAPRGTYGIHGNSTPESISTFASGGCVRMFNNDVAELFSKVAIGTPVQIVYENIELKLDKYTNKPVLIIYPDVYKKKNAEAVLKKLKESNDAITEEQAEKALKLAAQSSISTIAVAEGTPIMLNNRFVTNDAFVENNEVYVYYLAAFDFFGLDGETTASLKIKTLQKDNRIYISMTDAASKIGLKLTYDEQNSNIYLTGSIIKVNGKFLTGYIGGFDRSYKYSLEVLKYVEEGIYPVSSTTQVVDLKDYAEKKSWGFNADSLYKTVSIDIPLKVKVGEAYLDTALIDNRHYIKYEASACIPGIEGQTINPYEFDGIKYIDLYELMEGYEYKRDSFFTLIELIKPLDSTVQEAPEPESDLDSDAETDNTVE